MMMKLTFEGRTLGDILDEMQGMLDKFKPGVLTADPGPVVPKVIVPKADVFVDKPVDRPMAKPVEKKARSEKQLANDEKMRVAALERVAARRAAKAQSPAHANVAEKAAARAAKATERPSEPVKKLVEKFVEELAEDLRPDPIGKEPEVDPAELVKIRQKTIEELQAAYANGHNKEVMELLSRFGNGAKSFRELPAESFMPIRRAIDLGALE